MSDTLEQLGMQGAPPASGPPAPDKKGPGRPPGAKTGSGKGPAKVQKIALEGDAKPPAGAKPASKPAAKKPRDMKPEDAMQLLTLVFMAAAKVRKRPAFALTPEDVMDPDTQKLARDLAAGVNGLPDALRGYIMAANSAGGLGAGLIILGLKKEMDAQGIDRAVMMGG